MKKLVFLALLTLTLVPAVAQRRPNIVFIYGDDVGYGDLGPYGATAVKTPNVDALARTGLKFTSAYATSATCTPSRFSLMTGTYAFRKQGTGVLPGDAALIVDPSKVTLPSVLKKAGYRTGVVGKWHLGLGPSSGKLNWNEEIKPGPRETGFDYSFIMAATGDRVPCVYVEDGKVVGLNPSDPISVDYAQPFEGEPTGKTARATLKMDWDHGHNMAVVNGIGRIGFMKGGRSALWVDEDMADVFTRQAVSFIEKNSDKPFFLYFATHDIHVPRVPNPRFAGKTTMGPRGDVIAEFDWSVGEIIKTLDRLGLRQNTLIILSSDNGPVVNDGYKDQAVEKLGSHKPAGPLRGGKYSIFEGGTRIPFIVNWPGKVTPGVSNALFSQVDFLASFAAFTGQPLKADEAADSRNLEQVLLGRDRKGRSFIVEQAGGLGIREGRWKYIDPRKGPKLAVETNTELGNDTEPQLFDLEKDPGEKQNLASSKPEIVARLKARVDQIRAGGDGSRKP